MACVLYSAAGTCRVCGRALDVAAAVCLSSRQMRGATRTVRNKYTGQETGGWLHRCPEPDCLEREFNNAQQASDVTRFQLKCIKMMTFQMQIAYILALSYKTSFKYFFISLSKILKSKIYLKNDNKKKHNYFIKRSKCIPYITRNSRTIRQNSPHFRLVLNQPEVYAFSVN